MTTQARGTSAQERPRLVERRLRVPFILLVCCFAAWGAAANLTDVLVGVFRSIFDMSNVQSSLVQFAYYGAYFLLAVPAAFITRRFGYKTGVLTGLGLAALGALLFIPASQLLLYGWFLLALFVLAAGLSILETSANPFIIALGSPVTGTRRLNLAQAFNPVGANIGVALGALIILPYLTPEATRQALSGEELRVSQEQDLFRVLVPYVAIAVVLVVIWVLIAARRFDAPGEQSEVVVPDGNVLSRLWANRHYRYGVMAQFFNVAAQTCTWTFTILYAQDVVGLTAGQAGWFLQASLLVFLVSRFVMVWLLGLFRPTRLLLVMALFGVACCLVAVLVPTIVGLLAVVAISASLSLMFPTIYGVSLQGLGGDTKFGAAGLVMAILGGALLPIVHAGVMDVSTAQAGYIVPGVCLLLVAGYAMFDLRTRSDDEAEVAAGRTA